MAEVELPRAHEPMAPNDTVGNTSPKKRKVEEDGDEKPRKVSSPVVAKKPRQEGDVSISPPRAPTSSAGSSTPLVQRKGRKLVLKQDPFKITPHPRRMLDFEGLVLDAEDEGKKVTQIPEEYWGLVAMLGHESTSRTEAALVKQIKTALTGRVGREKDTLSADALTPLVSRLFTQNDYGFLVSDFSPSSSTIKLPAALQLRYWEVDQPDKYFSADQLVTVISRVEERKRARAECLRLLGEMDDIERLELLRGDKEKGEKKPAKGETDRKGKAAANGADPIVVDGEDDTGPSSWPSEAPTVLSRTVREGTANTIDSARSARSVSPAKKAKMTPEEAEAARQRKEEREAKKVERAEKKAEAERAAEKAKQNLAKQQQAFSMFRKKPPAEPVASPARVVAAPSETSASPSRPMLSDYDKTFKPVQKRPNVEWAPINRWRESGRARDANQAESSSVQSWTANDYLRDHLKTNGHAFAPPPRASLPSGLKSAPLFGTVADFWQTLEDAEDPRKVLAVLNDRKRFPWKVLAFHEDVRPPYCGTYAKKSIAVGGRTPFAQDPALDYGYDSAEDWVDDEGGEDVDDFGEAAAGSDNEDDEGEEEDEFDDWLDDSEDVGLIQPGDGSSDGSPEPMVLAEQSKLPQQVVKSRPVPKKVVKLKPFIRGPMWEDKIGEGSSGMQEYRLQLINDTPDTIDPFKYNSSDPVQAFKTNYSSTVIGTNLAVRCLLAADPITSRPPVPPFDAPPVAPPTALDTTEPKASSSRAAPKVAFPATHLADLLRSIEGSTKIRTDLVSQLREKFEGVASKAAIEAKLREVAVREGKTKDSAWKVHPDAWIAAGLPVPQSSSSEPQKRTILPLPLPGESPFMKDEYTVDLPRPPQMAVDSSSF